MKTRKLGFYFERLSPNCTLNKQGTTTKTFETFHEHKNLSASQEMSVFCIKLNL